MDEGRVLTVDVGNHIQHVLRLFRILMRSSLLDLYAPSFSFAQF